MNTKIHFRYWTDKDIETLNNSKSFKDLALLALDIISRIPGDIQMISGPISTGGVGSIAGNRRVFERVIEIMVEENNLNIFSQMPFEDKMVEFYKQWHKDNPTEKYCMPILEDFYELVFSSGKIKVLQFIHNWESSFGARWEHAGCDRWRIERRFLSADLSQRALA